MTIPVRRPFIRRRVPGFHIPTLNPNMHWMIVAKEAWRLQGNVKLSSHDLNLRRQFSSRITKAWWLKEVRSGGCYDETRPDGGPFSRFREGVSNKALVNSSTGFGAAAHPYPVLRDVRPAIHLRSLPEAHISENQSKSGAKMTNYYGKRPPTSNHTSSAF